MAKVNPIHHGDLKRALLDVAITRLDEHGIEGVTIRAVARDAGVSHGAPVNHYRDRRALLTAVAKAQFEVLAAEIEAGLAAQDDHPDDRIEVFASAIMDFGFRYPHRYRLLWRGDLVDHQDEGLLLVMDGIYDSLCEEIEKAIPQATFEAKFDKDTFAVAFWSMLHGYVDLRLSGMFVPLDDSVSGKPRREALIDLFRSLFSV